MTGRATSPRRHWPAFALVLLALLLRAGIPAGYMLGTDAAGAVVVELCSGQAMVMPMPMPMPMRHGSGHHDPGQKQEMPCPFGVLAAPAMPPAPPVVAAAPLILAPVLLSNFVPTLFSPQPAAPPPPSTGPPVRR